MRAINGGTVYAVDSQGWVPKVIADIKTDKPCALVMNAAIMADVMKSIQTQGTAIAGLVTGATNMLPAQLAAFIAGAPSPALVIGALASAGAVGGALGMVAVCAAIAHSHGHQVSVSFVVPADLLGPSQAELHVEFTPVLKA